MITSQQVEDEFLSAIDSLNRFEKTEIEATLTVNENSEYALDVRVMTVERNEGSAEFKGRIVVDEYDSVHTVIPIILIQLATAYQMKFEEVSKWPIH